MKEFAFVAPLQFKNIIYDQYVSKSKFVDEPVVVVQGGTSIDSIPLMTPVTLGIPTH